jgi:predicted RNase H-like nuclease (RuvC/YqgF family)
MTQAEFLHLI